MGGKELESASPDNSFKKFGSKQKRNGDKTGGRSQERRGFGLCFFLKLGEITAYLPADPEDSVLSCSNYFKNKSYILG